MFGRRKKQHFFCIYRKFEYTLLGSNQFMYWHNFQKDLNAADSSQNGYCGLKISIAMIFITQCAEHCGGLKRKKAHCNVEWQVML